MDNRNNRQSEAFSFIGEKTPAKIAGLSYTVTALLFFALSLVFILLFGEDTTSQAALYGSFLVAPVAFLLVGCWYFRYTKTSVRSFIKEQKCPAKYYGIALMMQVGLLSLGELNVLFLRFLEELGYTETGITLPSMQGIGFVGVLLTVAVLPAVFEELFFRGIFLREMKGFSVWARLLLCGGLFALYHQNPVQTVYQFLCGVAFAFVAVRAKSFFPTVLSHFLNNAVIVVLQKCGVNEYPLPVYIALLVLSAICLIVSVIWLVKDTPQEEKGSKGEYSHLFKGAFIGIVVFGVTWFSVLLSGF